MPTPRRPPLLVGLAVAITNALTAATTVQGFDAGESISTAFTFGVPHPPGFPLFALLAALFTHALPTRPELAVALLSATASGLAAALTCSLLLRLGVTRFTAIISVATWSLLPETW